jgi:hypothetical protein
MYKPLMFEIKSFAIIKQNKGEIERERTASSSYYSLGKERAIFLPPHRMVYIIPAPHEHPGLSLNDSFSVSVEH